MWYFKGVLKFSKLLSLLQRSLRCFLKSTINSFVLLTLRWRLLSWHHKCQFTYLPPIGWLVVAVTPAPALPTLALEGHYALKTPDISTHTCLPPVTHISNHWTHVDSITCVITFPISVCSQTLWWRQSWVAADGTGSAYFYNHHSCVPMARCVS